VDNGNVANQSTKLPRKLQKSNPQKFVESGVLIVETIRINATVSQYGLPELYPSRGRASGRHADRRERQASLDVDGGDRGYRAGDFVWIEEMNFLRENWDVGFIVVSVGLILGWALFIVVISPLMP
jgi:hypothetical protein